AAVAVPPPPGGPTERLPLGTICGARSGDKGGNANVGVWARNVAAYAWLAEALTVDTFRRLVPEAAALPVERHALPALWGRGRATPRDRSHIPYIMRSPLAPVGWPKLLSPPSGFTGCGPSPAKRPSSTSFHALPRGEKPMSSMRTSSVGVKQSCTSAMLISARGSFTPACR